MSKQAPPKIEFPCLNYPVKIMGEHSEAYQGKALAIVEKHAPGFDRAKMTQRVSSKGSFRSITVFIKATGESQLRALHQELIALPETKMVL